MFAFRQNLYINTNSSQAQASRSFLSTIPVTFYRRKFARNDGKDVPPVSEKLAGRLQQILNAEITAVLSIPLVATLMARGVWYWDDFPWPAGLTLAIAATVGSFYLYGRQALTWTEDDGGGGVGKSDEEIAV